MGTATAAPQKFLLWTRYRDPSGTATAAPHNDLYYVFAIVITGDAHHLFIYKFRYILTICDENKNPRNSVTEQYSPISVNNIDLIYFLMSKLKVIKKFLGHFRTHFTYTLTICDESKHPRNSVKE